MVGTRSPLDLQGVNRGSDQAGRPWRRHHQYHKIWPTRPGSRSLQAISQLESWSSVRYLEPESHSESGIWTRIKRSANLCTNLRLMSWLNEYTSTNSVTEQQSCTYLITTHTYIHNFSIRHFGTVWEKHRYPGWQMQSKVVWYFEDWFETVERLNGWDKVIEMTRDDDMSFQDCISMFWSAACWAIMSLEMRGPDLRWILLVHSNIVSCHMQLPVGCSAIQVCSMKTILSVNT